MLKLISFWCSTRPTLIRCCVAVLMLIRLSVRKVLTCGGEERSHRETPVHSLGSSSSLLSSIILLFFTSLFIFVHLASTFCSWPRCFSIYIPLFLFHYIAANLYPNPPHITLLFQLNPNSQKLYEEAFVVCFFFFPSSIILYIAVLVSHKRVKSALLSWWYHSWHILI